VSADDYVNQIVDKYAVDTSQNSVVYKTAMTFKTVAEQWADQCLRSVSVSGSFAKLTAVSSSLAGGSDIDLFISLTSTTKQTMKELYEMLYQYLTDKKFTVKRQNVSLGIKVGSVAIDFVPAKHQDGNDEDHTLYVRRGDTWKKTNVQTHITYVLWSGCTTEIKVLKIWNRLHGLDFLSFYLELFAIRAIGGNPSNSVATNVWTALQAIRDNLENWCIIDPANSNNVISDQHTADEKKKIVAQSKVALGKATWGEVIW
jgi:hypothetical protein